MAIITIKLNPEAHARLEELAQARQQPVAIASEILCNYVGQQNSLEKLLEGIEDGQSLGEYNWGKPRGAEIY